MWPAGGYFFLLFYNPFFFSLSLSHTLIKKCHTYCIVYFYCGNWHSSYQPWSSLSLLVHCSRHFAYHACAVDRIPFATATESFSGFIPQGLGPFILIFIVCMHTLHLLLFFRISLFPFDLAETFPGVRKLLLRADHAIPMNRPLRRLSVEYFCLRWCQSQRSQQ